ncbi:MAG: SGNH/GDSL hydrolase family protein [Candidatus Eisenbacteria sp.]|nr:SGNH/GDSL hydrolase family protein [Candidatus Eisenbacteria bacterium]
MSSLILAVGVIEVSLRLFAPLEFVGHVEFDRQLGWRGRPGIHSRFRDGRSPVEVVQNAMGFRDLDRLQSKPEGTTRVLCVGDSFTWGWRVDQESIFTRVLEEQLLDEGRRVEVINAGVNGYGTVQCLLYVSRKGFDLSPDVVIYQACYNDIADNAHGPLGAIWHRPLAKLDESSKPVITRCPVPPLTVFELAKYHATRHSRFACFIKHRRDLYRSTRDGQRKKSEKKDDTAVDEEFRLFAALVARFREECAARGVRLAVVADFPLSLERRSFWVNECPEVEAHFIHEYLVTQGELNGTPAFIPDDWHWTEAGHAWVAEYIHERVLPRGQSPSAATPGLWYWVDGSQHERHELSEDGSAPLAEPRGEAFGRHLSRKGGRSLPGPRVVHAGGGHPQSASVRGHHLFRGRERLGRGLGKWVGTFSAGHQYQSEGGFFVRPTMNMLCRDEGLLLIPGVALGGSF